MKHLEQINVEFTGSLSRTRIQDGVAIKYFRNNFVVDGEVKSISSADDLAGLTGTVAFVKAGEVGPDGSTKIVQNAFTLIGVTSITSLQNKVMRKKLENEAKSLD